MDVSKATAIVVALRVPRFVRALRRYGRLRPRPQHPPIERLAADLRRLLRAYDTLSHSPDVAARAAHLRALEAALADCASETARALGVPYPPGDRHTPLPKSELRLLLRDLAAAGLVLPGNIRP
jgi:DNA-binding helix-hairpin-helix protein with protein kinase domain